MSTDYADATIDDTAEERQAMAIAKLPQHLAVIKMENDNIQSLAAAHPRNYESVKRDLLAQLDAYPSFAAEAIYAKPVGKDESGRQKIARGLSIRAAEAIAEAYGFCRVRTDVTPVDDDTVKVEATFVDYQKGRIWQDGGLVSKWYKGGRAQGYKMIKHADDRFYGVVVKAEISRRVREVITRSVPPGLRAELFDMAERRMATLLTDDKVKKLVGSFAGIGVTQAMVEGYIGRTAAAGWTEEDRIDLLGLWNAIKEGETTVADAFGEHGYKAPGADAPKAAPAGPVKASDLMGDGKAAPANPAKRAEYEAQLSRCMAHADVEAVMLLAKGDKSLSSGDYELLDERAAQIIENINAEAAGS